MAKASRTVPWQLALKLASGAYQSDSKKQMLSELFHCAKSCVKASKWSFSLALIEASDALAPGQPRNAMLVGIATNACARASRWEAAQRLLMDSIHQKMQPDMVSFNVALHACATGGNLQAAMALRSEALRRHLKPTAVTYNTLISASDKSSMWRAALGLLSEMRSLRHSAEIQGHSAVLSACEKGSQWERALLVFSEAAEDPGVGTDAIMCSAAISACEKGSAWEHSLRLLGALGQAGYDVDVQLSTSVLKTFEKISLWQQALFTFHHLARMAARRLPPEAHRDGSEEAVPSTLLASACLKAGAVRPALMALGHTCRLAEAWTSRTEAQPAGRAPSPFEQRVGREAGTARAPATRFESSFGSTVSAPSVHEQVPVALFLEGHQLWRGPRQRCYERKIERPALGRLGALSEQRHHHHHHQHHRVIDRLLEDVLHMGTPSTRRLVSELGLRDGSNEPLGSRLQPGG